MPLRGPTSTGAPAAIAGFSVPVKSTVPPPAFTRVRLDEIESSPSAIGAVIAEDLTVTVAAVPSCVAVSVASPLPKAPQSALIVAVWGVTASAAGAKASPVTARAPAASAAPAPIRLHLMGFRLPFHGGGTARQVNADTLRESRT